VKKAKNGRREKRFLSIAPAVDGFVAVGCIIGKL
jgi:hypothetical protein